MAQTIPGVGVTVSEALGKGIAGNFQLCDLQEGKQSYGLELNLQKQQGLSSADLSFLHPQSRSDPPVEASVALTALGMETSWLCARKGLRPYVIAPPHHLCAWPQSARDSPLSTHPVVLIGRHRGELRLREDEGLEVLLGVALAVLARVHEHHVEAGLVAVHGVEDDLGSRRGRAGGRGSCLELHLSTPRDCS